MIKRRTILALFVLCALLGAAVAAQSAAASSKGTTGFTCKEVAKGGAGTVGFKDAHCKEPAEGEAVKYEHFAFPPDTTTELTVSNTTTEGGTQIAILKATIFGIVLELQATGVHAEGTMENKLNAATQEHYARGQSATTYSGVTVTIPTGKGCKVKGGEIKTNNLTWTTAEQGMLGKLAPTEGTTIAEFTIEGCTLESVNRTYKVSGSITCPLEGATVHCSHAEVTASGTLKLGSEASLVKAGIEVNTTAKARDAAAGDTKYTPLAFTTVETP